jgi:hypothetical protein
MSRDRLEWTLALLDRASGPARRVAKGLDAVSASQERVTRAAKGAGSRGPIDSIERGLRRRRGAREARVGRELDDLVRGQRAVASSGVNAGALVGGAFMAIGAAALGAALAVGRITLALGESMVQAADWRNRTEGAFRVLLSAQDRPALVGQAFQRASQYAQRFGLDVRDVARQMVQLTAAGFSQSEIPQVMQAAGDLGALEGPQAAERAITAIRQIRAKGVLQMEELSGQLADAGLSVGDVVAEIGRARGLRGDETAVGNQVRSLITARRVSAQQGISAIMGVIARRSGGRLGGTLDTQSRGAEAAMNRLRNSWLLLQSNFARSPAFARIIGFVERMATALDPASAGAQRFGAQLDRFFNVITGAAARIDPVALFNGMVAAIGTIGSALARIAPYAQAWVTNFYGPIALSLQRVTTRVGGFFAAIFGGSGPSINTIAALARGFALVAQIALGVAGVVVGAFGLVARVIAVPLTAITAFWRSLVGAFSGVELSFVGIGTAIVRGLVSGVTAAASAAYDSVRGLANGVVTSVKGALGIRSPSRVFAQLGGHVADGFALGIEGGTGGVRSAIGSMVDVGAVGARAASAARAGGGPLALTINVTAPEGADADEWGAVIASHVARELGTRTERAA